MVSDIPAGDRKVANLFFTVYMFTVLFPFTKAHIHCKNTIPKMRNKYAQQRNCAASIPIFTFCVSVSDLNIPMIGLPILLQENMWTDDPGNI